MLASDFRYYKSILLAYHPRTNSYLPRLWFGHPYSERSPLAERLAEQEQAKAA